MRFHEGWEVGPRLRRQKRLPVDDGGHLRQAVDDLPLGIDQKRGQDLERQHGIISISSSLSGASRRSFGPLAAGNPGIPAEQAEFAVPFARSEEHTSELQSLMRISYAVFCLKKTKNNTNK